MSLSQNTFKISHVKALHADLNKHRSALTLLCDDQGEKLALLRHYVLIRNADEPCGERLGKPLGLLLLGKLVYVEKIHRVSELLLCLRASLRNPAHDDQM